MTHLGYIVAAYGAGFAVLGGLALWAISDLRAQIRSLKGLEEQGLGRRPTRTTA
ncbi:MAG TPA: heme exporter protein CcmD [Afifellaceae bacterium]|nr:heme exporter protein CcmD [Afifellaceae bacterium]